MDPEEIDDFVSSLSDDQIRTLYCRYYSGAYDHLLLYPVEPLSSHQEREALWMYLDANINSPKIEDEEDELKTGLTEIVRNGDYQRLKDKLKCDQYWEEPFYHMANQGRVDFDLDAIVQRIMHS